MHAVVLGYIRLSSKMVVDVLLLNERSSGHEYLLGNFLEGGTHHLIKLGYKSVDDG